MVLYRHTIHPKTFVNFRKHCTKFKFHYTLSSSQTMAVLFTEHYINRIHFKNKHILILRRSSISWSEAKLFGGQTWFGSLLGSLSTVINITLICSVQFTKYSDYHSHVNNIHIYLFSSDKSPSLKANA